MRARSLSGTLCFGAAAAVASVFVQQLTSPLLGHSNGLALYWVCCTIAYAALLGPTRRRALRNGFAALAGSSLAAVLTPDLSTLAVGLAVVLALVRSGLELRMRPARAIGVETGIGLLALAFAAWIAGPGPISQAVALWGFALVQGLYFLVPGHRSGKRPRQGADAFDRARAQLLRLLGEA